MRIFKGGGLFLAAITLVIFGVILRWDLIDGIIDATGFMLIVIGAIIGIIGLIQMFSGGGKKSGDFDF